MFGLLRALLGDPRQRSTNDVEGRFYIGRMLTALRRPSRKQANSLTLLLSADDRTLDDLGLTRAGLLSLSKNQKRRSTDRAHPQTDKNQGRKQASLIP